PHVDAHAIAHHGDLVHQADIDHAKGVLEQFHHLGHTGRADGHYFLQRLRVEQPAHLRACGSDAADYFGDIERLVIGIAWVDALRREAEKEILAYAQIVLLQHREYKLVGCAGIRGRFENHEHACVEVPGDLLRRRDDVAHVRILGLAQGRRDADV